MATMVFVECILCGREKVLSRDSVSDKTAVKLAERAGWTVKPTICKGCHAKYPGRKLAGRLRQWRAWSKKHRKCPDCHGCGKTKVTPRSYGTCQTCHGDGVVRKGFRGTVLQALPF